MITFADTTNKNELKNLWQMTFLEDSQVIDNFFENIFDSVVTPVIKIDGEIVSSLFLLPCKIGEYNGKCVYCAMTKYAHRGKGHMKKLLDFSYDYCKNNKFDFLFLVPAESSLFEYYSKCGFQNFGISRICTLSDVKPDYKDKLEYKYELEFDKAIYDYWKNSCRIYGGDVTDFGLIFDDEEIVIRNAHGNFEDVPKEYKKAGTVIKGDINFGDAHSPAMLKTENEKLKYLDCYVGITLE